MNNKEYKNKYYSSRNYHNRENSSNIGFFIFLISLFLFMSLVLWLGFNYKNLKEDTKNKVKDNNIISKSDKTINKITTKAVPIKKTQLDTKPENKANSNASMPFRFLPNRKYADNSNFNYSPVQKKEGSDGRGLARKLFGQSSTTSKLEKKAQATETKEEKLERLGQRLKEISSEYREKLLEFNNLKAEDKKEKQKEFNEYEKNYKKELMIVSKKLELVRNQKESTLSDNNTANRSSLASNEIKQTDEKDKAFINKEIEKDEMVMKQDFSRMTSRLNSLSENELIEEYDISQTIKKEKIKKYGISDNKLFENFSFTVNSFFCQLALRKDYSRLLDVVLKDGYSIDSLYLSSLPVMFWACEYDKNRCLNVLINNNADLTRELTFSKNDSIKNKELKIEREGWFEGKTLLHSAAQKGNIYLARKVLEAGIPINKRTKNGKTPLFFAVINNQKEMVSFLLQNGAEVEDYLDNLTTNRAILFYLNFCKSQNNNTEAENTFPENDSDKTVNLIIKTGKIEKFFEVNDSVGDNEWRDAYNLIKTGKLVKLFELSEHKDLSKMSFMGEPAPCIASEFNNIQIIKFLIFKYKCENLVDSANSRNALHYAVINSNKEIAGLLLNNGFSPNIKDKKLNTPLHFAVNDYSANIIDALLHKGADINALNINKESPLVLAVKNGNFKAVKVLIRNGANVNIQDSDGNTPLNCAVNTSSEVFVNYLLQNGADPNILNSKKQNSLHLALLNDDAKIIELLLEKGADMNQQDSEGNTPLHYTALFASNNSDILDLLSKYKEKFNLNIKNNEGKTPRNITDIDCFF